MAHRFLVFGGSGAIGGAIAEAGARRGWQVVSVSRSLPQTVVEGIEAIAFDPFKEEYASSTLSKAGPFDAVCYAQGANINDSIYNVEREKHIEIYRANCLYILETLQPMLLAGALTHPARVCIISSIWQNRSRQSKLTYSMTKAALQGLVLSLTADMGKDGDLVNAVQPGVVDTPMTRRTLSPEQIGKFNAGTQFGRLATLDDVSSIVTYLCSPENTGITGQFIAADLGYSSVRIV
jgi:NAD(P)-dependent dehydrogenase (short-subunit alcohol dehydrogenase family)